MEKTKRMLKCSNTFLELEDLIDVYIKKWKQGKTVEAIYEEIIDIGLNGNSEEAALNFRAFAFVCLLRHINVNGINRIDYLKNQINQIRVELYTYPLLDYAVKYVGQSMCYRDARKITTKERLKPYYLFEMIRSFVTEANASRKMNLDSEEIANLVGEPFLNLAAAITETITVRKKRYFAYELEYEYFDMMLKDFGEFVSNVIVAGTYDYSNMIFVDKNDCNEYLLGFLNYMHNRSIYASDRDASDISMAQLTEHYLQSKHAHELLVLRNFINSADIPYIRNRVAELYKDDPDDVAALAYSYAKSFDSVANITSSGVPEIDDAIKSMQKH